MATAGMADPIMLPQPAGRQPWHPAAISSPASPLARGASLAFGRRFFYLISLALALWLPALARPQFSLWVGVYCAVILGLWIWDLCRLPAVSDWNIERSWSAPPPLGGGMQVIWQLACKTRHGSSRCTIEVSWQDDLPMALTGASADEPWTQTAVWPAGHPSRTITSARTLHPCQRGVQTCGDLYLQFQSTWGLAVRRGRARLTQSVMVLPDLEAARHQALPAMLDLPLAREMRPTRTRARGREFEALRPFREGDEWRDLDWRATARAGRWIVKQRRSERNQMVWLVLDCGRLLQARPSGTSLHSLLDITTTAALSLAMAASFGGDQVGLLAYGREIQILQPPAAGQGMAGQVRRILPALGQLRQESSEADHRRAASLLLRLLKRRAFIVWLSELPETAFVPELAEAGSLLARRHLLLLTLPEPTEVEALAGQTPRQARDMYVITAALEMLQRRRRALARQRDQGAQVLEIPAARITAAVVERYMRIKERGDL